MRELSLNILDITQNSITAGASLIEIEVFEDTRLKTLAVNIIDNGRGMSEEQLMSVRDPFFTTRTTRKVGMGIPLFKLAAEQTGGRFSINSALGKGTVVNALFKTDSVDFTPLGDVSASVLTLIQGHPDTDFLFRHQTDDGTVELDTRELREVLEDVPLNSYDVLEWIGGNLQEQYEALSEDDGMSGEE
jgi:hypothetical protein